MRNYKVLPVLVLLVAFLLAALPYSLFHGSRLQIAFLGHVSSNFMTTHHDETRKLFIPKPVWDDFINVTLEKARCDRYGFGYDGRTHRRRVFLGGLIADDTWHPLQAVAEEGYGLYHSVSYIESNMTQMQYPRRLRFTRGSEEIERLSTLFGPSTRVTVDSVYIDKGVAGLKREDMQREYILHRWKINGMRQEDIGIVADTDETFTRDFLRAAQICDIPEFRPGQDCTRNKIVARTMVFESSPECITQRRLWYHPDMSLGECIFHIGDDTIHKPATRIFEGYRTVYDKDELKARREGKESFPLLQAPDIRMMSHGGVTYQLMHHFDWDEAAKKTGQPVRYNAFHFHNFFDNATTLRNKMATYGHPHPKAWEIPLGALHRDIQTAINCVFNRTDKAGHEEVPKAVPGGLSVIVGPIPVFFENETYREERNEQFRQMVLEDEVRYGRGTAD